MIGARSPEAFADSSNATEDVVNVGSSRLVVKRT